MLEQLKEALDLTLKLAQAVKDNDLESASNIQQKRITLLQAAEQLNSPTEAEKQKQIQEVTLQIKEIETNLEAYLSEQKANIAGQHKEQKKREKMVRAYKDIGG